MRSRIRSKRDCDCHCYDYGERYCYRYCYRRTIRRRRAPDLGGTLPTERPDQRQRGFRYLPHPEQRNLR